MDILESVKEFKRLRDERRELEAKAKEVKAKETELSDKILQSMQNEHIKTIKWPEVGTVVCVDKKHYEVRDREKFCEAILQSMVIAYKKGRALNDALIVQARPQAEALSVFLEESSKTLDEVGLIEVIKPELSVRKA